LNTCIPAHLCYTIHNPSQQTMSLDPLWSELVLGIRSLVRQGNNKVDTFIVGTEFISMYRLPYSENRKNSWGDAIRIHNPRCLPKCGPPNIVLPSFCKSVIRLFYVCHRSRL
jgi:hypothetical protein